MTEQEPHIEHHECNTEAWRDGILGQQLVELLEAALQTPDSPN